MTWSPKGQLAADVGLRAVFGVEGGQFRDGNRGGNQSRSSMSRGGNCRMEVLLMLVLVERSSTQHVFPPISCT